MTGKKWVKGERGRRGRHAQGVKEEERRVKKESYVSIYIINIYILLSTIPPPSVCFYIFLYSPLCVRGGGERGKKAVRHGNTLPPDAPAALDVQVHARTTGKQPRTHGV